MIDGTPTGEDKQWADLAAENETEDEAPAPSGGDGEGGGEREEASPDADAAAEPAKPAPIPYEELESRHRQTTGALKAAREEAQFAKDQLRAYNQMVEDLRASRKAPEPAKPAEVEIDPNEDPVGYFQNEIAKLHTQLTETHKSASEARELFEARQEYQQFMGQVSKAEDAFVAVTPDYHQAAEYLEKGRRSELAIMYPDTPQGEHVARQHGFTSAAALREAVFMQDAQSVARNALQMGLNPAQAYYELAKGRGYKPGNGGGGAPEDKTAKANGVIEAMRRGAKASRTLSGAGGAPDNPLNLSDLTDLYAEDPEEFDRQWDKMAKAGKLG
jgi:hypothetical protein